jgi:hypothetical protein
MKNKISFRKKLKLFREFKRVLKLNKLEIEQSFKVRIDNAYRIYTVINLPVEEIGEPYNLRKSDIDKIAETHIKEYVISISRYLDSKGLKEMYNFYDIKKVEKYSYLVVIGFSIKNDTFRSDRYYTNLKYTMIISTLMLLLSVLFVLLFKLF